MIRFERRAEGDQAVHLDVAARSTPTSSRTKSSSAARGRSRLADTPGGQLCAAETDLTPPPPSPIGKDRNLP